MTGITVTQETLTPKDAATLLALNTHNRHVREDLVSTFARDISAGRWVLNGETIKIGKDGTLIDGQHRLMAVVKADKPIDAVIVRGLDNESQETIDTGARRRLADVLFMTKTPHNTTVAAATRWSWFLDRFGAPRASVATNPSQSELIEHLRKNPGLVEAAVLGVQAGHSTLRMTGSTAATLWYHMGRIDAKLRDEFWRQLLENEAPKGSAIYALRESILKDLGRPHRMSVTHRTAIVIKAWNSWLAGETRDYIMWRGNGPAPEPFPVLQGPDSRS